MNTEHRELIGEIEEFLRDEKKQKTLVPPVFRPRNNLENLSVFLLSQNSKFYEKNSRKLVAAMVVSFGVAMGGIETRNEIVTLGGATVMGVSCIMTILTSCSFMFYNKINPS